ncbi:MAG: hypothetical protein ACRDA5_11210, partial [Clostridium sp.]
MNNFKNVLKTNKKRALSIAVATAMATASLSGCSTKVYDPITGEEIKEEEETGGSGGSGGSYYNGGRSLTGGGK